MVLRLQLFCNYPFNVIFQESRISRARLNSLFRVSSFLVSSPLVRRVQQKSSQSLQSQPKSKKNLQKPKNKSSQLLLQLQLLQLHHLSNLRSLPNSRTKKRKKYQRLPIRCHMPILAIGLKKILFRFYLLRNYLLVLKCYLMQH